MAIAHLSWHKCYKESWKGEIVPEAFSHPAKAARGLARRIYAHAIERGWLKPGDTCLDPFAGIGGFALDALANGLNFVGVELEISFVDMGAGCDCTGISKADWVRCFGRWKQFAHKDGRHWCPRCLAEVGGVIDTCEPPRPTQAQAKRRARMRELIAKTGRKVDFSLYVPIPFPKSRKRQALRPPTLPGMEPEPTASYQRNSGEIPHTRPHRYAGNLDLFARHARGGATAVLVRGDSRRLVEVLEGARAEGLISSPPYSASTITDARHLHYDEKRREDSITRARQEGVPSGYGTSPAQLGNMPTGEPPSAVISSPPWESNLSRDGRGTNLKIHEQLEEKYHRRYGERSFPKETYGDSDGQLGTMPTGEPPQAVIASPPHGIAGVGHDAGHPRLDATEDARRGAEGCGRRPAYGTSDGQLAAMREGDAPTDYTHTPGSLTPTQFDAKAVTESITFTTAPRREEAIECEWEEDGMDGIIASPPFAGSQLAALPEGEPPQAIISSPPYAESLDHAPGNKTWDHSKGTPGNIKQDAYGNTDGQMGAMKQGEPPAGIVQVDACVSSPPWEQQLSVQDAKFFRKKSLQCRRNPDSPSVQGASTYGADPAQLGNQQGDTFWSAAKTILLQCHAVLAPGGVAIFVCKRFVRDKKIVEFSQQWADLCQSCGFELIEWIKAWLIEERGTQYDLEGEAHTKIVKRFSFFRRLHAQKYPHLAIEWEDIIIFRKPRS